MSKPRNLNFAMLALTILVFAGGASFAQAQPCNLFERCYVVQPSSQSNGVTEISGHVKMVGGVFTIEDAWSGTYAVYMDSRGRSGFSGIQIGLGQVIRTDHNDAIKLTGGWSNPMDGRLFTKVRPYSQGLDAILKLHPVEYELTGRTVYPNSYQGFPGVGFDGEELNRLFPGVCSTYKTKVQPTDEEESEVYKCDMSLMLPAVVKSLHDLKAEINSLRNRPVTVWPDGLRHN